MGDVIKNFGSKQFILSMYGMTIVLIGMLTKVIPGDMVIIALGIVIPSWLGREHTKAKNNKK